MAHRNFDTLAFSESLYKQCKPSLTFAARSLKEARTWQCKLRRVVRRLLGGSREPVPLRPEIIATKEFPTYIRETVYFDSCRDLSVFGYMLVPKTFTAPGPVVICCPGHGRGCDEIVGIQADGSQRKEYGEYQKDFALQCVDNGIAAFALELVGFGHRRDVAAVKRGPGASSCQPASGAALLFGETMAGWRVHDVTRTLDYLLTRPEVDARRIGVMGISGGGTVLLYAAALDLRIRAAVLSGSFNTYRASIMSISHCIDNYVPGILRYAEMYDVAGLIAPRPLFVESGTQDSIFPIEATKFAFRKLSHIYRVFGAADRIGLEVFEGEHQFWGKGAFSFLKRVL